VRDSHLRALIPGELLIKRLLNEEIVVREEEIMTQDFQDGENIIGLFSMVLNDKGRRLLDDWSKVDDSLTYERVPD